MSGFLDPDAALDYVQGMQRAREAYGDPPEPAFAVSIIHHAESTGLRARFIRTLDDEDGMVWVLEVDTGRGVLELRPSRTQTWREYLGSDPEAVDLALLPADAPR